MQKCWQSKLADCTVLYRLFLNSIFEQKILFYGVIKFAVKRNVVVSKIATIQTTLSNNFFIGFFRFTCSFMLTFFFFFSSFLGIWKTFNFYIGNKNDRKWLVNKNCLHLFGGHQRCCWLYHHRWLCFTNFWPNLSDTAKIVHVFGKR